MTAYLLALFVSALMLAGALFALTAAIGVLRLPDLYSRMHAASKAGTVGAGLIFLAIGFHDGEITTFVRACAGIAFLCLQLRSPRICLRAPRIRSAIHCTRIQFRMNCKAAKMVSFEAYFAFFSVGASVFLRSIGDFL
nr:monovalent cation/H(+) antiporter subunit G [Marinicella sp. W31]MDC2876528.1 monovalent cation/H(+) antiporter subunit G [Marinicella sp. W31]